MSISPCVHPHCRARDEDGNRSLIGENMCRVCINQVSRDLVDNYQDFLRFKRTLPSPVSRGGQARHTARQSFGHPAEDASIAASEIVGNLNHLEALLRDHLGESPAPPMRGLDSGPMSEEQLARDAYLYLSGHVEELCGWPDVGGPAGALYETHETNRFIYGYTVVSEHREGPCPDCDVAALFSENRRIPGKPQMVSMVTCRHCAYTMTEDEYLAQARRRVAWEITVWEAERPPE